MKSLLLIFSQNDGFGDSWDNILVLDVFFEALNYETIEQKKAYEVAGLLEYLRPHAKPLRNHKPHSERATSDNTGDPRGDCMLIPRKGVSPLPRLEHRAIPQGQTNSKLRFASARKN
ncbi:UNVERIFIED_CONTAM: hypothetical protein FKN15_053511 [Acipenser sinensis]